jgi:hypothetical protein
MELAEIKLRSRAVSARVKKHFFHKIKRAAG